MLTNRGSVEGEESMFDHYHETESAMSQLPLDSDVVMTTQLSHPSSNMQQIKKAIQSVSGK